ncbi:MAG: MBOAT family protein [Lachnospiraceae bacterium]|jgi:alginate O-acetyltransferase complex protein AlgI|nr:MBOAT family protein [Lachnospiraceae bacterium]
MNFAEMGFIFRFLPVLLVVTYLTPKRFREKILLVGSLVFYAFGELRLMPVLLAAMVFNFLLGYRRRRGLIITAIVGDLLLLVSFKLLSATLGGEYLPLGISFYIFRMISWQADLLNGEIDRKEKFSDVCLYFCLFPQILSGPIMRYGDGEFGRSREYRAEAIEAGVQYFIIGLGMKVILADRLAILWNDLQTVGFVSISTPLAWMGAIGYSMQLYFDFWGYSLMAAGIGMMVGFKFITNFNHPYAARSIGDFYRRWHMTLGGWFRDYVYIPMGGSRWGAGRTAVNLLVVWGLTGLWHGSGINFIIWGLVLGGLIILEKLVYGRLLQKVPVVGHLYVLFLIPLSWVVFAVTDLGQLGVYFSRLFPFVTSAGGQANPGVLSAYLRSYGWLFVVGGLLCLPGLFKLFERYKKRRVVTLLLIPVFWVSIFLLAGASGNPFMYLNF